MTNETIGGLQRQPFYASYKNVAAAGAAQASATPVVAGVSRVTGATGATGVKLPKVILGQMLTVYNDDADDLLIYPYLGESISGGSANSAVTLSGNSLAVFVGAELGNWAAQLGGILSGNLSVTGDIAATGSITAGTSLVATTTIASGTTITAGTYFLRSVGGALTAVGTNRATALQLAKEVNNVTTAGSGTGVILPVGVIGMRITVFNAGANAIQVYATASETIDTVAGSTGVPLTNTKRADFFFTAANTWISAQLGVVSA